MSLWYQIFLKIHKSSQHLKTQHPIYKRKIWLNYSSHPKIYHRSRFPISVFWIPEKIKLRTCSRYFRKNHDNIRWWIDNNLFMNSDFNPPISEVCKLDHQILFIGDIDSSKEECLEEFKIKAVISAIKDITIQHEGIVPMRNYHLVLFVHKDRW